MLEMDLVQGKPALYVEFHSSLVTDLRDAMMLLASSPWIEGLDNWVYATHAALAPTLKQELEIVNALVLSCETFSAWAYRLPFDHPAHTDLALLLEWLGCLPPTEWHTLVQSAVNCLMRHCEDDEAAIPEGDQVPDLRACLAVKLAEEQVEMAVRLLENPADLKSYLFSVLTRFWEEVYRLEHRRCLPLMQRSIDYHRGREHSTDLETLFTAVTGRRLPKEKADMDEIERLVFVPSCHVGPYLLLNRPQEMSTTLFVHYNCRPTAAREGEPSPPIHDLFPPLKALADETRLQILALLHGRELYAQEIVDQLDISQSAVSRHLKLMVTSGVLTMRKQESMKYFAINQEILAKLAERLSSFRSELE